MIVSTAATNRATIRNPLNDEPAARSPQRVTVADRLEAVTILVPFTGQELAQVPVGTQADVDEAFKRARAARKKWTCMVPEKRGEVLHHFHDLLFTHCDQALDLPQAETSKSRVSAHEEFVHAAITARYYGSQGLKSLESKRTHGAVPVLSKTTVYHYPKGVVGVIAPWSYSPTLTIPDALTALMAGNTIVFKPDSITPFTAPFAIDSLYRVGPPEDLFQAIPGPSRVVSQGIVGQCDFLMFTGSSKTGHLLAQQYDERLVSFSAEFNGKNLLIVAEDVNINRAVKGVRIGYFTNFGHPHVSIERIYVTDSVWDGFVPASTDRVKVMLIGAGYEWETKTGRLQSQGQSDMVKSVVDETIEAGATVLAGGRPRPGLGPLFYEPIMLTDVLEGVALLTEEVFGPAVILQCVLDAHGVIVRFNDSRYGLNASLWTSPRRAKELASQPEAGTVNVNDGFTAAFASVNVPMGGFRDSGVGRCQATGGSLKYTDEQMVTVQCLSPVSMSQMSRELYSKVFNTALALGKKFNVLP